MKTRWPKIAPWMRPILKGFAGDQVDDLFQKVAQAKHVSAGLTKQPEAAVVIRCGHCLRSEIVDQLAAPRKSSKSTIDAIEEELFRFTCGHVGCEVAS